MRRKARKREKCGLTEAARKRYVVSRPHVAMRHGPCPSAEAPASQPHIGDIRNAGFASEVRIAATRDLPAAGVRSGIGYHVGSAPGARRVSRAAAGGFARTGPG